MYRRPRDKVGEPLSIGGSRLTNIRSELSLSEQVDIYSIAN